MKVLIIDDAVDLNNTISKILKNYNYEVDSAYDGKNGLRMALRNEYDVILLDIMMPQMNGYEVLKKLRAEGRITPVILITARDDINDKIDGLELGADDYLPKPFNMNELTARIKALIRRSNISNYEDDILQYADIILNSERKEIKKENAKVYITETECKIMKYLINHSEIIVSEEKLLYKGDLLPTESDTLNSYVSNLQRLFMVLNSKVRIIIIKGCGYKLCC